MKLRSITQVKDLAGKRVLVRVDYNVPISKKGKVEETYRIAASLPTIELLLEHKARVILVTHIGRPGGRVVKELRVDPVAKVLERVLKKKVKIIRTKDWSDMTSIEKVAAAIKPGGIALCDNVRFAEGEEKNAAYFSKELASLADIFVLDGFGVAHRMSPSVTGVADYIPSYAGLLLEREIKGLSQALEAPKKGSVLVIGGAKMETKLPVISHLRKKVETILTGGGIVNTYLKSRGFGIGSSIVDATLLKEAKKLEKEHPVLWPVDLVVGRKDGSDARVVTIGDRPFSICNDGEAIFDIGPKTIRRYAGYMKTATTIIWNGAMGYFEQKPYDTGTLAIARLVAARSQGEAFGVVGGGETIQALRMVKMEDMVDLVSTGGGAMLEFLAGESLPGVKMVSKK